MSRIGRVVRVIPDVTGLDKEFDYLVPDGLGRARRDAGAGAAARPAGRRVGGRRRSSDAAVDVARLRPLAAVSSRGPAPELIELARWAAVRWAAARLRPFLVTASPPTNVAGLPAPRRTGLAPSPIHDGAAGLLAAGGGMLRLPPADDVVPVLLAAVALGPVLVDRRRPSTRPACWRRGCGGPGSPSPCTRRSGRRRPPASTS